MEHEVLFLWFSLCRSKENQQTYRGSILTDFSTGKELLALTACLSVCKYGKGRMGEEDISPLNMLQCALSEYFRNWTAEMLVTRTIWLSFFVSSLVCVQERTGVKMIMIQDGPLPTGADKPLRITGDAFKVQVCIKEGFAVHANRSFRRIWNNGTVGSVGDLSSGVRLVGQHLSPAAELFSCLPPPLYIPTTTFTVVLYLNWIFQVKGKGQERKQILTLQKSCSLVGTMQQRYLWKRNIVLPAASAVCFWAASAADVQHPKVP